MRAIDAHKLEKVLNEYYKPDRAKPYGGLSADAIAAMSAIGNAPAIDAEPVRHGYWIDLKDSNGIKIRQCSVCGKWDNRMTAVIGHYCWSCGAKMDGRTDNE